jgi:arylsulfatase A-like enzyme
MDACIANMLATIAALGIEEETLIVFDSDHGETLFDHDCYFDHHGIYDVTIRIPLVFHYPGKVPAGQRIGDFVQMKDVMPTLLDLLGVKTKLKFDGRSLRPLMQGRPRKQEPEMYLTEATWMRKHGWRTPEWKLIHALEPDFHFKPEVELYNLITDPGENHNVAAQEPEVVALLEGRMAAHIAKREKETGRRNPAFTNLNWAGHGAAFVSSQEAYDTLHIGSPHAAEALQKKELQTQRGAKVL